MDDLAATRVHVLVVGVPGFPLLRLRALAALRRRGWVAASSPADADVLLVCGTPDAALRAAVDAAWAQVPVPRARRTAVDAGALDALLDSAVRVLGDRRLQAESAPERTRVRSSASDPARLGPVLPDWPAGLVVDLTVRNRRVVESTVAAAPVDGVEVDPLSPDDAAFVQACDRASRLLRLAGWPAAAARVDRCIDRVLAGDPASAQLPDVRQAAARAARSVLLQADLAPVPDEALRRLLVILGDAERSALGEPEVDEPIDPRVLEQSLRGVDVEQVRLLVAIAGTDPLAPTADDAAEPASVASTPMEAEDPDRRQAPEGMPHVDDVQVAQAEERPEPVEDPQGPVGPQDEGTPEALEDREARSDAEDPRPPRHPEDVQDVQGLEDALAADDAQGLATVQDPDDPQDPEDAQAADDPQDPRDADDPQPAPHPEGTQDAEDARDAHGVRDGDDPRQLQVAHPADASRDPAGVRSDEDPDDSLDEEGVKAPEPRLDAPGEDGSNDPATPLDAGGAGRSSPVQDPEELEGPLDPEDPTDARRRDDPEDATDAAAPTAVRPPQDPQGVRDPSDAHGAPAPDRPQDLHGLLSADAVGPSAPAAGTVRAGARSDEGGPGA